MSNYKKNKLLSFLNQQVDEYFNPETDPRTPLYNEKAKLENMDGIELMEHFREDDDSGDAVKAEVLKKLEEAEAPQDEIDRVEDMTPSEVLSEFGIDNIETIRQNAINNVETQIDAAEENLRHLQEEIETVENTPSRYFD